MRTLIAEDDLTSRILLEEMLESFGVVHVTVNGEEALLAFTNALNQGTPYQFICLDINMPKKNGQEVLKQMRSLEARFGARPAVIVMTTGDRNRESVISSAKNKCNGYLIKPIKAEAITTALKKFRLIA